MDPLVIYAGSLAFNVKDCFNQLLESMILEGVTMVSLKRKVAVVTGASRGVGKGVALGLGEAGATVYVTGRTSQEGTDIEKLGGTVLTTAEEVTAKGGKGVAVICDHRDDSQVEKLFQRLAQDNRRLDVLVNNVWGGYEQMEHDGEFTWLHPFWTQPFWRWDAMFNAGVRAAYTSSALAAPMMIKKKKGLIVNISFWSAQVYLSNTQYGVSKAAVDKMTEYMAHELKKYKVAVVSLYPGLVRTESVMRNEKFFDMSNSESPQFIGRVVAALASDPNIMKKSGQVLVAAQEALDYGIKDIDGKQPRPLTLKDF